MSSTSEVRFLAPALEVIMQGARWRKDDDRKSEHPTNLLFHCADAHGVQGYVPAWAEGESWGTFHAELHAAKDFGGKEPHDYVPV